MFPGTLNSSTRQASSRPGLQGEGISLFWKIRQSTEGTGAGDLGLGLALRPRDFKSKLSRVLKSIPRVPLTRAQKRPAAKTALQETSLIFQQTKSPAAGEELCTPGSRRGGVGVIGAFDLFRAQLAEGSQDWVEECKQLPTALNPLGSESPRWLHPVQPQACSGLGWSSVQMPHVDTVMLGQRRLQPRRPFLETQASLVGSRAVLPPQAPLLGL